MKDNTKAQTPDSGGLGDMYDFRGGPNDPSSLVIAAGYELSETIFVARDQWGPSEVYARQSEHARTYVFVPE